MSGTSGKRKVESGASCFLARFKEKTCLTSVDFMTAWNHYDKDKNGMIEANEIDEFLRDLLEVESQRLSQGQVKELKANLLAMYDVNKDGKLSLEEMASVLPTEENFLLQFRRKDLLSSIDFIRVWKHYDQDKSGQMETNELEGFLRDVMARHGNTPKVEEIKEYAASMIQLFDSNGDGKLEIYDLINILPLECNFLQNFKGKKRLSRDDFGEIFSHYDADGNGFIEGDELFALLQDISRRYDENSSFSDLTEYKDCILDMCDENGDGKVEFDELALLLSKV